MNASKLRVFNNELTFLQMHICLDGNTIRAIACFILQKKQVQGGHGVGRRKGHLSPPLFFGFYQDFPIYQDFLPRKPVVWSLCPSAFFLPWKTLILKDITYQMA